MYLAGIQKPQARAASTALRVGRTLATVGGPSDATHSAFTDAERQQAAAREQQRLQAIARNVGVRKTPHVIAVERYRALQSRGMPYAQILTTLRNEGLYEAFVSI